MLIVNGGQHLLWPPETEIKDFDEFLRNTLRAGASPQFSRGHSSASSQIHRPFYQTFSMIAKSLSLIILYRFTTLPQPCIRQYIQRRKAHHFETSNSRTLDEKIKEQKLMESNLPEDVINA